jgi:crossover junction endodeoxyribonuclease RuvC
MGARVTKKKLPPAFAAALARANGDEAGAAKLERLAQAEQALIKAPPPRRVLSIDPALRNTGWAVLERDPKSRQYKALGYGVIQNAAKLSQSQCLAEIFRSLDEIIIGHKPEVCAVEGVIFVQSLRTAITMGAARGAAMVAVARHGLEIHEYAPRKAKQAVVGTGAAQKSQVAFMIRSLLRLAETPPSDAADALAIAMAHFQAMDAPAGLGSRGIKV